MEDSVCTTGSMENMAGERMASILGSCQRAWINANLATMDPSVNTPYGLLTNHALGIKDQKIAAILPMEQAELEDFSGEIIDAEGACITPGLIDSHTHLIWGGNRAAEHELRMKGASYQEIARSGGGILATVQATRARSEDQLFLEAVPRLEALLREGVTTLEIKSGYGLEIEEELKMLRVASRLEESWPVRIRKTLLAAHAIPPEFGDDPDSYITMICDELIPRTADECLADAVDVFCEDIAFTIEQSQRVFQAARKAGLGIKIHAEQLTHT